MIQLSPAFPLLLQDHAVCLFPQENERTNLRDPPDDAIQNQAAVRAAARDSAASIDHAAALDWQKEEEERLA